MGSSEVTDKATEASRRSAASFYRMNQQLADRALLVLVALEEVVRVDPCVDQAQRSCFRRTLGLVEEHCTTEMLAILRHPFQSGQFLPQTLDASC